MKVIWGGVGGGEREREREREGVSGECKIIWRGCTYVIIHTHKPSQPWEQIRICNAYISFPAV